MDRAPPPHIAPTPELERQVRTAQAEMVFERSRTSNLIGIPVALLICSVLWDAVPHTPLLVWLAAKVAVTLWRIALMRRYDEQKPARTLYWERHFLVALAADGIVFGGLGTWLLPADPVMAMVMVATLLGIAAVGLVVLSMNYRAALALTVPVLLPPMLWQMSLGGAPHLYVAAGMAVFLGLVLVEGRRAHEHTAAMLRLQFGAGELARQREQALALAERSNAVKGQFLATMSHEMRTPLHGILGLARLLRHPQAGDPPAAATQRLQTLERTGEHLLLLINDVLDYSRIEGGHLRLAREPFDLAALLHAVADLSRVQAAEKGLTLMLVLDGSLPEPCPVTGDPARCRQVLLNLLGNAVKFTERGQVTLRARALAGGWWRLEVEDTGPGVPENQRERIFEAFEQLDGSFARRHGGTGLGLTISRELVQAMGGRIGCDAAPGGGALFWIEWPAPAATLPAQAPATLPEAGEGEPLRGRVLLVEDNAVNALVAQALLQRLGLEVTTVSDGEQAVAEATREPLPYALVLMDCQMPGTDGFQATQRIREHELRMQRPRLPIVAVTANAMPGDRERSLRSGMDAHLAKPFRDHELASMVRQQLRA